jgi:integrase
MLYKSTKNKNKRIIDVTSEMIDILRLVKEEQDKFKDAAEADKDAPQYTDNHLVFCRDNGQAIHPDTPSTWFPAFCIDCGLPRLTFHCLRHTHASHLLAEGEDISYVSKRLAHSDITITYKTYFHFIPLEKRDFIKKIESKFKNN